MNAWAEAAAGLPMIFSHTVPWVTVENTNARQLAMQWIDSAKKEHVATAGWCTYSGLTAITSDEALDLTEIESLLGRVVTAIGGAPNAVKLNMNGFVIAVGTYVQPLLKQAKAAALKIGTVSVDQGDTACKVPLAIAYIEKNEASGRLGKKRKTIRC